MSGQLGCAGRYSAVLHWRGGGKVFSVSGLHDVTNVSWGRSLNEISEARVAIAKQSVSAECCAEFGRAEPWIHELTIYRDGDLVWQGPVLRSVESRGQIVIEAVDVMGWLERVVNTWRIRYVANSDPGGWGRYRRPITEIAQNIIRLNLVESSLSTEPDWPGILDYVVRIDSTDPITFEKDGSSDRAIWSERLTVVLEELAKRGLYYTTVGRSIVFSRRTTTSDLPVARLGLDDILGDVEVIKDGTSAATLSFATNQQSNELDGSTTVVVGERNTEYGRLDHLEKVVTDEESEDPDDVRNDLLLAARSALAGRYPAPIAITVPEGALLSPAAPIRVDELVCGQRVDVATNGYCTQIQQAFVIAEVSGTWEDGSERIGMSLIPIADPYGVEIPPEGGGGEGA